MSCPTGKICVACAHGCSKGLPYLDIEQDVIPRCQSDNAFKARTQAICTIAVGKASNEFVSGHDVVHKRRGFTNRVIALYDGYTEEQFAAKYPNTTATKSGLTPTEIEHPRTNELMQVFWMPSCPAFRCEVSTDDNAIHRTDCMPSQVYAGQANATMDHFQHNLTSETYGMVEPPSQDQILKSITLQRSAGGSKLSSMASVPASPVRSPTAQAASPLSSEGSPQVLRRTAQSASSNVLARGPRAIDLATLRTLMSSGQPAVQARIPSPAPSLLASLF